VLPGLFHPAAAGLMPGRYQITGSSRRGLTGKQSRTPSRRSRPPVTVYSRSGAPSREF